MATINDIANACHISKATVSRYLNQSGYVSEDVAKKIALTIKELNYVPSATARNLSKQKNNMIGVMIPEVSNPFFAEVFKGISEIADKHELNIIYMDTNNHPDKELKSLSLLRSYEIQGLILTPVAPSTYNEAYDQSISTALKALNVPVVILDRTLTKQKWDGVFSDNFTGMYDLTKCLIEAGHKSIATVTGDLSLTLAQERYQGYRTAILESTDTFQSNLVIQGDFTSETAYSKTIELIESNKSFSAIVSSNNLTTLGIIKALSEKNLRIPEDIALVCFDDIEILQALNYNLTVAYRDNIDMGRQAMNLLYKKMENKNDKENRHIQIKPQIIMRGSEKKQSIEGDFI